MREIEIRRALLEDLTQGHICETLVIEEMGLDQGSIRIDVAVVNGILAGFEIKSDSDTLERLPAQRDTYNRVFDEVTIVTGPRHLEHVVPLIPDWWGVIVAERTRGGVLHRTRPAARNPARDPALLARLLWHAEAIDILGRYGAAGLAREPRRILWEKLAAMLAPDDLAAEVRSALKARSGWSTVRLRS